MVGDRTMNKLIAALSFSALFAATGSAFADGVLIAPAALSAADRATLQKHIGEERVAHPQAFDAVKGVRGYRIDSYGKARNPRPHVVRELKALGAPALFPMLNELAIEAPPRDGATDDEWTALTVGLLEAVG